MFSSVLEPIVLVHVERCARLSGRDLVVADSFEGTGLVSCWLLVGGRCLL